MTSLSRQFIQNIFSSSTAFAIRIMLNFLFIPYITFMYGGARYGVWVIIFQTITYFTLFDFGINSALVKYVSEYFSKKDFAKINKILATANTVYISVGTLVFFAVYIFIQLFFDQFKIDSPELIEEGKNALTILGLFIAMHFYTIAYCNSQAAFQRHDIIKALHAIEEIIRISLMALLIKMGYGLQALATLLLITSTLRSIAGFIWMKRLFPEIKLQLFSFDNETAKKLFGYSKITFFISLGWLIMFSSDNFILGLLSSSVAAGVYSPGAQLMLYLRNIINTIGVPLIPAISHLNTNNSTEKIKQIYLKGIKYISFISFVMSTGVILYAKPFVALWLDSEFAQTADVMVVLAVGTAFFIPQIIGNSILFGAGKHKIILIVLTCEVITKLVLSIFLIPLFGVIGMALANTAPQVLFYTTLYPILIGRYLKIPISKILVESLKTIVPAILITSAFGMLQQKYFVVDSWMTLFVQVVIILGAVAVYGYLLIEDDDKKLFKDFVKR